MVRAGSSGGGVRARFAPDLVAMCRGRILVIEAKYRSEPATVALGEERAARLLDFAARAGGEAYLAVKYGRNPWRAKKITEPTRIAITPTEYPNLPELRHIVMAVLSYRLA